MLNAPMTKPEWIENLLNDKSWVFVFKMGEVTEMFPEWPLDHHLQTFCATHRLSYRIVRGHYLFTRALPQSIVEELTGKMERGESLNLVTAMT